MKKVSLKTSERIARETERQACIAQVEAVFASRKGWITGLEKQLAADILDALKKGLTCAPLDTDGSKRGP